MQIHGRISSYYPERAGKIFLINVPSVFSKFWALIKPMLDSVTQVQGVMKSAEARDIVQRQRFEAGGSL